MKNFTGFTHYTHLPTPLKNSLNVMRFYMEEDELMQEPTNKILNLTELVSWVKEELPDFDTTWIEGVTKFEEGVWADKNNHQVFEDELMLNTLLRIKDCYELNKKKEK